MAECPAGLQAFFIAIARLIESSARDRYITKVAQHIGHRQAVIEPASQQHAFLKIGFGLLERTLPKSQHAQIGQDIGEPGGGRCGAGQLQCRSQNLLRAAIIAGLAQHAADAAQRGNFGDLIARTAGQGQAGIKIAPGGTHIAKMLARLAGQPIQADPPADRVGDIRIIGAIEHIKRLFKHGTGILQGTDAQSVAPGLLQVSQRPRHNAGLPPVIGEQRIVGCQHRFLPAALIGVIIIGIGNHFDRRTAIAAVALLIPLSDGPVQLAALREQHQIVDHFLNDGVLETVDRLGLAAVGNRNIEPGQGIEIIAQVIGGNIGWKNRLERAIGKDPPENAGDLQRQLLSRRQPVDPADNGALHGFRKAEPFQVGTGCQHTAITDDLDQAGIAQGKGQRLTVERVALCPLADQFGNRRGQAAHPKPTANQFNALGGTERIHMQCQRLLAKTVILRRNAVAGARRAATGNRAHRHEQQHPLHPLHHSESQRP